MTRAKKAKQAVKIFAAEGLSPHLTAFLEDLKRDPLAFSLAHIAISVAKNEGVLVIKKAHRLLPKIEKDPESTLYLFRLMGAAYKQMGELDIASAYFIKAIEFAEQIGDQDGMIRAGIWLCYIRFQKAEYELFRSDIARYSSKVLTGMHLIDLPYGLALYEMIGGSIEKAIQTSDSLLDNDGLGISRYAIKELKAFCLRLKGKLPEAVRLLTESAEGYLEFGSAYAAFPVAKALEIFRLAGFEPPSKTLIRKAITLARKGSWGEQAAAQEAEALLIGDDADAAEGLLDAASNYIKAYQNIEALFSGLTAAYLAWRADSPVFARSLKLIGHLIPLHPNFKKDPILGEFISIVEPLVAGVSNTNENKGIRAFLIGKLRVSVNGKEINPLEWRSQKAAMLLIYLLLSSKHRIAADHLFYLLWPKKRYNKKNRELLYQAVSFARKSLGDKDLITHKHDFYQLEDVWTDLGELENLIYRADATHDQKERDELLDKARELARNELLPEILDDHYIDEHRQYYERLRKRVLREK